MDESLEADQFLRVSFFDQEELFLFLSAPPNSGDKRIRGTRGIINEENIDG
jgi:hypothetical protein